MAWTHELVQQKDNNGNNIPLWTVIQWNTDNTNQKWETTITQAVKEAVYD
jgi:hypothetical protein|tara:strand:+ start:1682 stop:1831 length:150 start_codon:yes stop_codon:yes gene_type:complete